MEQAVDEAEATSGGAIGRRWRPFGHVRLAGFFGLLALLGGLGGVLALRLVGADTSPGRAAGVVVGVAVLVAASGFAGVLVHRLRVLPLRWEETERLVRAVQRESEKYRLLMEGAADMLLLVDPLTGHLREWNAQARRGLALPGEGAPAPAFAELVVEADRPRLAQALERAQGERDGAVPLGELRLRAPGGGELVADARLAAIAIERAPVVLLALRDMTRQKAVERELTLRQHLATIGLLTAGVAHEVNNPLEGIANYLRLARREDLPADRRDASLEQVARGFERIRDIVRQLLRFARPQGEVEQVDLAEVVERAVQLARFSEPLREVVVALRGLDRPLPVAGDAGRLEQVVFNLLLNAATAMEGRGTITVGISSPGADEASELELQVDDEGPGIAPEHLDRLFDPFFSTSGGTGLGLPVSYGIVRAHGGTLTAANRTGGGARFTVRLPVRRPS